MNKKICFFAITFLLMVWPGNSATTPDAQQILSNTIAGLTGNGDTLWMVTQDEQGRYGLNGTVDAGLNWIGFKVQRPVRAFGFAAKTALVFFDTASYRAPSRFWSYSFASSTVTTDSMRWAFADTAIDLSVSDVASNGAQFWLACGGAGILQWRASADSATVFVPGQSHAAWKMSQIGTVLGPQLLRGDAKVSAVEVTGVGSDSTIIWAVTASKIWRCSLIDTVWDSLTTTCADSISRTFVEFFDIHVRQGAGPILARAVARRTVSGVYDTSLFIYNKYQQSWKTVLAIAPGALTLGDSNSFFALTDDKVEKYRDTLVSGAAVLLAGEEKFRGRILASDNIEYPRFLTDISFRPRSNGRDGALWIATSAGLFYCPAEDSGRGAAAPYVRMSRALPLKNGLKQVYAYPGILNSDPFDPQSKGRAVFAYTLDKSADVTIKVFDYNMDCVKTVINREPRLAGNLRQIGRSTNEQRDFWDGTTDRGRRVAVGVYYFLISASTGERSFGKIIIAQ